MNMMNYLNSSTNLMKRTPYLRRKFLSFKKNLMKSKKIFQKLKLQKSLLRRKMKSFLKRMNGYSLHFQNSLVDKRLLT